MLINGILTMWLLIFLSVYIRPFRAFKKNICIMGSGIVIYTLVERDFGMWSIIRPDGGVPKDGMVFVVWVPLRGQGARCCVPCTVCQVTCAMYCVPGSARQVLYARCCVLGAVYQVLEVKNASRPLVRKLGVRIWSLGSK